MPAPVASDGAKMPPGTPLQAVSQVVKNFSGPNASAPGGAWPCSSWVAGATPEPKVEPWAARPISVTTSPIAAAKRIGQR